MRTNNDLYIKLYDNFKKFVKFFKFQSKMIKIYNDMFQICHSIHYVYNMTIIKNINYIIKI